ncbi:LysR family transcriptional regulator [Ramlibacter sp. AW1]|uniref:LysR family transcriptional regulator n=1 Tax=Ramlibacter aurantiacus TaxID=2801330 RepID=A0A937D434_9BURK|nr:LysR family transcriptional regulator [Ramlibacter aurantiacus]MBL0423349.1 LysR family transcriptional regulator [Ramlibacter aurantiacus]
MRINKLDLNQLACLDALLQERNVSRAAERVHLSQPALSATLARMREYFGDPLLIPSGRTLTLTPFAHSLLVPMRDLLLRAQALTQLRPEVDPARFQRDVTIVSSDYVLHLLLTRVFERAAMEAPGLRFEVRSIGGYIEQELEQGDVDLVVSLASALILKDHPSEEVLRDSFCCIAWDGNTELAAGLTLEAYLRLGHVVTLLGRGRVPTLDQLAVERLGLERRVEVRVPGFTFLPSCVVGTQRVATLQTHFARMLATQYPLRLLPCPMPIEEIVTAVQWHRYQTMDPVVRWVRQALHDAARAVIASAPASPVAAPRRPPRRRR